jgi:hypothetical protein
MGPKFFIESFKVCIKKEQRRQECPETLESAVGVNEQEQAHGVFRCNRELTAKALQANIKPPLSARGFSLAATGSSITV